MFDKLKRGIKKIVKGAKKVMREKEAFKMQIHDDVKEILIKENFVDIGIMILCTAIGVGVGVGSGFIIVGTRNKS